MADIAMNRQQSGLAQRPILAAILLVGIGLVSGLGLSHLPLQAGSFAIGGGGVAAVPATQGSAYAAYQAYRAGEWASATSAADTYAAYQAYRAGEWASATSAADTYAAYQAYRAGERESDTP